MMDDHNPQSLADYLAQLIKDRKQLAAFPNVFVHVERLLDNGENIYRVLSMTFLIYISRCYFSLSFRNYFINLPLHEDLCRRELEAGFYNRWIHKYRLK